MILKRIPDFRIRNTILNKPYAMCETVEESTSPLCDAAKCVAFVFVPIATCAHGSIKTRGAEARDWSSFTVAICCNPQRQVRANTYIYIYIYIYEPPLPYI